MNRVVFLIVLNYLCLFVLNYNQLFVDHQLSPIIIARSTHSHYSIKCKGKGILGEADSISCGYQLSSSYR
jgi:hypothetical protein